MKLVHIERLIDRGLFARSAEWKRIDSEIRDAIHRVRWPPGAGEFTIFPQSGKARGEGNGVVPIKRACMDALRDLYRWDLEVRYRIGQGKGVGPIDAVRTVGKDRFALEWETGNISSSHRSLNKMCLGMSQARLCGGALILPTRGLYRFLTDRIGNWDEIVPYLPFWRNAVQADGVLAIYVVEHDAESTRAPRIRKGTDGRALL